MPDKAATVAAEYRWIPADAGLESRSEAYTLTVKNGMGSGSYNPRNRCSRECKCASSWPPFFCLGRRYGDPFQSISRDDVGVNAPDECHHRGDLCSGYGMGGTAPGVMRRFNVFFGQPLQRLRRHSRVSTPSVHLHWRTKAAACNDERSVPAQCFCASLQ
jgi:hypothetical protein